MFNSRVRNDELKSTAEYWISFQWLAMIGEFTPHLAHELKQPLSSIYNFSDGLMFGMAKLPMDEIFRAIELISREAVRASDIVKRMQFAGKGGLFKLRSTNINDVIRNSLGIVTGYLRSEQISVTTSLEESIAHVSADSERLEQVVLSLIKNAVEAMRELPSKERCINITTSVNDGYASIAIHNCGPCSSLEQLNSPPQPFRTTKCNAMGIGLWVSRSILSHHSGKLEYHQTSSMGLEAVVRLPVEIGHRSSNIP